MRALCEPIALMFVRQHFTTMLAQSTSQYYFVLKLAQSISQYYFVLQSLHKALPSTTLYYKACTKYVQVLQVLCTKACTKHFPVLLCTTKLAQRQPLHTASSFAEKLLHTASFYTEKLLHTVKLFTHREAFTQRNFYAERPFYTQRSFYFYTLKAFTHSKLLHTKSFTHSKLLQKEVVTQRSFPVHNGNRNCSSKTGSRRQSKNNTILKHF